MFYHKIFIKINSLVGSNNDRSRLAKAMNKNCQRHEVQMFLWCVIDGPEKLNNK